MLGAIIFSLTSSISPALVQKWRGYPPPEYRLYSAMIGSPILVVGCFWLGWTGHYSDIPWYVPAISTIPVGLGISSIFMSLLVSVSLEQSSAKADLNYPQAYLVDTYVVHAASAVAALTVVRSGVAAAFPLFTTQLFDGVSSLTQGFTYEGTHRGIVSIARNQLGVQSHWIHCSGIHACPFPIPQIWT